MMKQNLAPDRRNSYKMFAQIWVIAWGGSMFDAISTIFGVMVLGNIERNPIVHYLIATYGVRGIMLYLPIEAAFYAAMPMTLIIFLRRYKVEFDKIERYVISFCMGIVLCFPFLVAIANFIYILSQLR